MSTRSQRAQPEHLLDMRMSALIFFERLTKFVNVGFVGSEYLFVGLHGGPPPAGRLTVAFLAACYADQTTPRGPSVSRIVVIMELACVYRAWRYVPTNSSTGMQLLSTVLNTNFADFHAEASTLLVQAITERTFGEKSASDFSTLFNRGRVC